MFKELSFQRTDQLLVIENYAKKWNCFTQHSQTSHKSFNIKDFQFSHPLNIIISHNLFIHKKKYNLPWLSYQELTLHIENTALIF